MKNSTLTLGPPERALIAAAGRGSISLDWRYYAAARTLESHGLAYLHRSTFWLSTAGVALLGGC